MANENLLVRVNELLHYTKTSDTSNLSNIAAKIELLKGQYVDYRTIFETNIRKFECYKEKGKYKNNIKIVYDYMKFLHDTFKIPFAFDSKNAEDFDYYFDIYWIYKTLRKDSKQLLEDNTRIKSVFNFYYSILNYAELNIEQTEETRKKNKEFNYALADIDEDMLLADFYLYEKYRKLNFDTSMPFLKKVFTIILLSTLNQIKNKLTRDNYKKKCKVLYNPLNKNFKFNGIEIKFAKRRKQIIKYLSKYKVIEKGELYDKFASTVSRLKTQIYDATGYSDFIITNVEGFVFNTEDFDITGLEI